MKTIYVTSHHDALIHYKWFKAGSTSAEYPLTIGVFTGMTTDPFVTQPLNGIKFSTTDNDIDRFSSNCADINQDGWWPNRCFSIA